MGIRLYHGQVVLEKDIALVIGRNFFKIPEFVTDKHLPVAVGMFEIGQEFFPGFFGFLHDIRHNDGPHTPGHDAARH